MSIATHAWYGQAPASAPAGAGVRRRTAGDYYLALLGAVILGYAVAGRGFAYVGVPPVYVGEAALVLGLLVVAWEGSAMRAMSAPALAALAALAAWTAYRTVPYLDVYGLDAPRDAMVVGYGLYAVVVAGLLLARPERLVAAVRAYRTIAVVVLAVAWVVYLVVRQAPDLLPTWPWSIDTHAIEIKPGDLLVHLAAITAFLVLGFRKARPVWLVLLVLGVGIGMVGNRGGMVGYGVAMTALVVMKPPTARFRRLAAAVVLVMALALLAGTSGIRTNEGSRVFGVEQIVENVRSIAGTSDSQPLTTTAEWRLQWWSRIAGYTFGGPHFRDGKGFGINLATDDGFRVDQEQTLRSPHNVFMALLARGGVPALALWLLLQACWFGAVARAWLAARRAGQVRWMGVLAICVVYCTAALVNASFDVHLEGPMGAIPYWTFFGAGLAAARLRVSHPDLLKALAEGPEAPAAPAQKAWGW